jgi:hypothetical protein
MRRHRQAYCNLSTEEEDATTTQELNEVDDLVKSLPPVQSHGEASKAFGHGNITLSDLDFTELVNLRSLHETEQAKKGVRVQTAGKNKNLSLRMELIKKMHAVLKEVEDQAPGTGLERNARWRAPALGGREGVIDGQQAPSLPSGNTANADVAMKQAANAV